MLKFNKNSESMKNNVRTWKISLTFLNGAKSNNISDLLNLKVPHGIMLAQMQIWQIT